MSWQDREYYRDVGGGRRFVDNPLNWAPSLGSIAGIQIRIHIMFVLYIAFKLLRTAGQEFTFSFTAQWLLILFGSVFLHELGHCFAARRMNGSAESILMWPLGGLATVDAPRRPWPQFVTVAGGPLVNLVLWGLTAPFLYFEGTQDVIFEWSWRHSNWTSLYAWLTLISEINLGLLLFNVLLPMYPMDAGRMLLCALWRPLGLQKATMITTTVGMVVAVLVGLYALTQLGGPGTSEYPMILLALAFMGYMTCQGERRAAAAGMVTEDGFMGHDFSAGYTSLEGRPAKRDGFIARWRRKRAEGKRVREAASLVSQQLEVDRILAKVHDHGIQSLTRNEKRTLESATQQQRERERHRV